MPHRTPLVLTASTAALLAAAAPGSAHNAAAVIDCSSATITADRFAAGPNPATAVVSVDGVAGEPAAVVLDNTTPAVLALAIAPGAHQVTLTLSWRLPDHTRAPYVAASAAVTCPAPPAPEPVPVPAPTPVTVPTIEKAPVKTPTAGRTANPPKRVRYRCPAPLPSKAWQRIIFRRHGVRCPLLHPAPPVHIAVAGEWKGGRR